MSIALRGLYGLSGCIAFVFHLFSYLAHVILRACGCSIRRGASWLGGRWLCVRLLFHCGLPLSFSCLGRTVLTVGSNCYFVFWFIFYLGGLWSSRTFVHLAGFSGHLQPWWW